MRDLLRDYREDAEPGDEDDPEYRAEIFRIFRTLKWKPQDIKDPVYSAQYAEWLKKAPPED
jgi:hypothetical protein